jgi:adenylate cyclase
MADRPEFEIELVGDKPIRIRKGQTILDASLGAGIPHFHACGGNAECSTCRVLVMEGMENLSPVNEAEKKLRKVINLPANIRLACQTCVSDSPVRLRRIILEETDCSIYVQRAIKNGVGQQLGEKKELVLFFLDIRNFTPFVEAHLPFDAIHVIKSLYILFNYNVKSNKGLIIDTAGDGFYAVFGLETSLQDAADNGIKTGHAILKELKRFNETYLQPYFGVQFEIGIGMHSGEVIVGEVMVGQKSHISVMGLAVNVASRIQASTRKLDNSFIVSDKVIKNSSLKVEGERRIIRLRGVRDAIDVHLIGTPYKVVPFA